MSVERRFLTGAREADVDDAGLVIEDDGTVWKVAPGGARTEVGASDGGSQTVGVVLSAPPVDISAPGASDNFLWDKAFDNSYDLNLLAELPAGIGLSHPVDGVTPVITVAEAGTWAMTCAICVPNDPNILFRIEPWFPAGLAEDTHGPGVVGKTVFGNQYVARITDVLQLPAGMEISSFVRTYVAASVSPLNTGDDFGTGYRTYLNIVRLG